MTMIGYQATDVPVCWCQCSWYLHWMTVIILRDNKKWRLKKNILTQTDYWPRSPNDYDQTSQSVRQNRIGDKLSNEQGTQALSKQRWVITLSVLSNEQGTQTGQNLDWLTTFVCIQHWKSHIKVLWLFQVFKYYWTSDCNNTSDYFIHTWSWIRHISIAKPGLSNCFIG